MKSSEAEQIVRSYAAAEDGYLKVLRALIQRYGSAKKVFPHLVHKITAKEPISITQERFSRYRNKYILPLQSMQELGCTDISQFAASLDLGKYYFASYSSPSYNGTLQLHHKSRKPGITGFHNWGHFPHIT